MGRWWWWQCNNHNNNHEDNKDGQKDNHKYDRKYLLVFVLLSAHLEKLCGLPCIFTQLLRKNTPSTSKTLINALKTYSLFLENNQLIRMWEYSVLIFLLLILVDTCWFCLYFILIKWSFEFPFQSLEGVHKFPCSQWSTMSARPSVRQSVRPSARIPIIFQTVTNMNLQ